MAANRPLTPEVASVIIAAKLVGHSDRKAAALAGVSRVSLYLWRRMGAEGREPYKQFAAGFDAAVQSYKTQEIARLAASCAVPVAAVA